MALRGISRASGGPSGSGSSGSVRIGAMKVGIVVPYSWSYWGGVGEHVELKVEALRKLGIETRTIIGHDPPGSFTRVLHPRHGRHGRPPADVIPVGRSVIVGPPASSSGLRRSCRQMAFGAGTVPDGGLHSSRQA